MSRNGAGRAGERGSSKVAEQEGEGVPKRQGHRVGALSAKGEGSGALVGTCRQGTASTLTTPWSQSSGVPTPPTLPKTPASLHRVTLGKTLQAPKTSWSL